MVTGVELATAVVVMVNFTLVVPAGIVTLTGTEAAAGFELESETVTPFAGAGAFTYTRLLMVLLPPAMAAGDSATEDTATGSSVSTAVFVTPPEEPEVVTGVEAATALVVIVNLTEVAPAGIVTLAGTAAAAFELESDTVTPFAGAGAFK
jgi:hypothetical protein